MFTKAELRITTAVSAALLAAGCGSRSNNAGWTATGNTAVCADQQGRRVADAECDREYASGGSHHYGWYYMGRGAYVPPIGGYARGGSYYAPAGSQFGRAPGGTASVTRGGFGSSAHASSGGRGG